MDKSVVNLYKLVKLTTLSTVKITLDIVCVWVYNKFVSR